MIKKKDIDLGSIVKQSILESKKDLGIIAEQENSKTNKKKFVYREFDPIRDIKLVDMNPGAWSLAGNPDANDIDAVLQNLVEAGEDPIQKIKSLFKNLNELMKVTKTSAGLTISKSAREFSSQQEKFSHAQIMRLLYTMFVESKPGVTGTWFESFIARAVGGYSTNRDDITIEDVRVGNNFLSLKVISSGTDITGSKFNLARGILSAEEAGGADSGIIYLVCVKDTNSFPMYFETFSFKINKNNFFKFVCRKPNPTADEIKAQAESILGRFIDALPDNLKTNPNFKKTLSENLILEGRPVTSIKIKQLTAAAENYATDKLGWNKQAGDLISHFFTKYFEDLVENVYSVSLNIKIGDKSLYEALSGTKETKALFPGFNELKKLMNPNDKPQQSFINDVLYSKIMQGYYNLSDNHNVWSFAETIEPDKNIRNLAVRVNNREVLSPEEYKIIDDHLKNNSSKYVNAWKTFVENEKVVSFFKFLDEFAYYAQKAQKEASSSANPEQPALAQPEIPSQPQTGLQNKTSSYIDLFFKYVKTNSETFKILSQSENSKQLEESKKDTGSRFEMSISLAKTLANTSEAELDDAYDTVYVDTKFLLKEGTQLENELKNDIFMKLFKDKHDLEQRYLQYFAYGELEGAKLLTSVVDDLKKDSTDFLQGLANKQPVQENKNNKHLTKQWAMDIFNKLIK